MRCYKVPFSWMVIEADQLPVWGDFYRNSPAHDLPECLYIVHICGFRFVFSSFEQIGEYKAFYDQPLKPSFRELGVGADGGYAAGDHGEAQSAFARLPLYLWQKGKRERVVAGLERAIREFAKG